MKRIYKSFQCFLALFMIILAAISAHAEESEEMSADMMFVGSSTLATKMTGALLDVESVFFPRDKNNIETSAATPQVKYALNNLYPNIDLICLGDDYQLEYIFLIHPGGDPSRILLSVDEASDVDINNTGKVAYKLRDFELVQSVPATFTREPQKERKPIEDAYNGIAYEETVCLSPGTIFETHITNEEFLRFLNDVQSHHDSLRAQNTFVGSDGRLWMNPAMKDYHLLFNIADSLLQYDSSRTLGERYFISTENNSEDYFISRPVAGVTWYGAVKFANWLTIVTGRDPKFTRYSEGHNPADWPKAPYENWLGHFFTVTSPDSAKGFIVDTLFPPSATIETHFLISFYADTMSKNNLPPPKDERFNDQLGEYVQPEPYDSAERSTSSKTTTQPTEPEVPPTPLAQKPKTEGIQYPDKFGILYKTSTDQSQGTESATESQASSGTGGGATGGTGGGATPAIATFVVRLNSQYPSTGINITVSRPDLNGNSNGSTTFNREFLPGTSVTFTAPPASPSGGLFLRWQRNGVDISNLETITVLTDANMTLTAIYQNIHTMTVLSSNPNNNVNITVNPADINSRTDITTSIDFSRSYLHGTVATLTADLIAPNGYRFFEWQSSLGPTYGTRTINVTMNSDLSLTAVYRPQRTLSTLSLNPNNGVGVTVAPTDLNGKNNVLTGGDFIRTYFDGTALNLTADLVAPGGNRFREWISSLGPTYASRTVNFTINADMTMTARYETPRTITLFSSNPDNGINITATPDINSNGDLVTVPTGTARIYDDSSSVTFTADLMGPGGTSFQAWQSSLGTIYPARTVTLTPISDFTLTAIYVLPWNLTVASLNPNTGIAVNATPDINSAGNLVTVPGGTIRTYYNNTAITLVAPSSEVGGNRFRRWQSSLGTFIYSTTANFNITTNMTMTARYDLLRILTVNSADPGNGVNVLISPGDISGQGNGFTTFSRTFDDGQNVTLTADNVASGQSFLKWQRNGVDYSTARTTTVTMDADYVMTAVYSYVPGPIDDPSPSPSQL